VAAVLGLLELTAVAGLVASPSFTVREVDVRGERRLSAAQVVQIAGLQRAVPVVTVDPEEVRGRLERSTWIRMAAVDVRLPDRVTIRVDEWQPVAVYRAGAGEPYYVSDQGVALGPAPGGAAGGPLVDIRGPARPEPVVGRPALDPRLLTALVNIRRDLPGLIGQQVRSFQIDGCGNLTMTTTRGWRAEFGRVLTPEEFASLSQKVLALKAAAGHVNYDDRHLDYVNVMNPQVVAVHDRRGPQAPSPSPTPAGPLDLDTAGGPRC
jgi:hypothetical protein